jgi:hypothetical protein
VNCQDLFSKLSDMDYRAAQIEFKGDEAIELVDLIMSLDKQPQILPEHAELICNRRHVIFLAMKIVQGRAVPEPGDVVIGSLCGRLAIVPRVRP